MVPETVSGLEHLAAGITCHASRVQVDCLAHGNQIFVRRDQLIFRDEDPDPVIFGSPDLDPVLFSTDPDPDPDPTCNNGFIKLLLS